jgi:hypothetical protein
VALYAISAVYFAGVMVRLMLTLTPVVCMLSAVAFSSVFEHYLGDDSKRETPPAEDSGDEDDRRNPGNLYDKVSPVSPAPLNVLSPPPSCFVERHTTGHSDRPREAADKIFFFHVLNSHKPFLCDFKLRNSNRFNLFYHPYR